MTKTQHKRTAVASMFQNGISRNTKCAERVGFAETVTGVMDYLSTTHRFDYIVLRINPGLTTCKDLAMTVDNSLDNN